MNNKKGFTLVEILVVIAIIGVLALLILPNFISSFRDANKKAMITQEHEMVDAAKLFIEDYCRHPLEENKGQCKRYSLKTNVSGKEYICLCTLVEKKYMEEIVSGGKTCSGYIVYSNKNDDYKAYLNCGDAYTTE